MPPDPPDLGFQLVLSFLRSAVRAAELLAAGRPGDAELGGIAVDLRSVVTRLEAHPEAPSDREG
jgi:hypothetical protein